MPIKIADRLNAIKPSPTFAINNKAKAMKAAGKDVMSMGVGEPDFNTPEHVKQAGIDAINANCTRYGAVPGSPELNQAIREKFKNENNLNYEADQIIVNNGAKQTLYVACQALLQAGDEAIIPRPYWVSYPAQVELAGATPVYIEAGIEQNFKITPNQLEAAITPNTRVLFLNSPSNPTGMVYSKAELVALAQVLLKHPNIVILSDDIYEHILWSGEFHNIVNACHELYDRTLVVNGVSKAYAMTGWRIGYGAGPKELIAAMRKIASHETSAACTISQKAATAALSGDQSDIPMMLAEYKKRHDFMQAAMDAIEGFNCLKTDGTFYLFPNVEGAMAKHGCKDDVEFADFILENAGVGVVPGSGFGMPGCIRLSIALSMQELEKAAEKIKAVV